jgi:hypothetical protein
MDDHCGCVISYMYKYEMKLYGLFPILVPIDPDYQGPRDKTMQGVGHDINKICKMFNQAHVQRTLVGFAPRPKPIFPLLGPQDREYSTTNLKPKLTPLVAILQFCRPMPPMAIIS